MSPYFFTNSCAGQPVFCVFSFPGDLRDVFMSRLLVSRKLAQEDDRTEHNNNMPLNLEKPINLEMRGAESRRHSITDRDSGMCNVSGS